ncbi:hypothetical protein BCR35DRAFT_301311 [Leucosporidium creatinivorum]|uniref:Zn(2)-C6 fungal-type domain-containing protein n=1 Tax=Leucosporidium creatinivorum TaxID=106004 RepID=A0A1Y2FYY9_9BASI|nr:hypothetical protein BCR35DRAFT_301311 [Leucosporidium creatinivorum]
MIRSYSDGSESPTSRSSSEALSSGGVVPGPPARLVASPQQQPLEQLDGSLLKSSSSGKAPRIVPCLQCRTIRRSCAWVEGQQACARCQKLGKACSGPAKRPRELLEVFKRASSLPSAAPSSPTSQMASTQLSYALTYHLVDLFLDVGRTLSFLGVDTNSFAQRFRETRGRASGLSEDDEILTFVYMLVGAQLSNHSAIVGPASSTVVPSFGSFRSSAEVPNISDIGLARRDSMMGIMNALTIRLRTLTLDDGRSLASRANRLALVWMSLGTYITVELEVDRHFGLGQVVGQGLLLLGHPDCHGPLRETIITYIQGVARAEVRSSYANGWVSSIASETYSAIFGPVSELPPLPQLRPDDLTTILSGDCTPEELSSIFDTHDFAVEAYFDALGRILVYASLSSVGTAVQQCWDAIDACSVTLRSTMHGILDDPRYKTMDPDIRGRRPCAFVTNSFGEELLGSLVLCGCHRALLKAGNAVDMLQESEERLCRSLSSIAEGVLLMLDLPSIHVGLFISMSNTSAAVGHHRPAFAKWVRERPQDCSDLLKGLRLAAYGLPDAAHLVQELEELLSRNDETDQLAASMVDGVLEQLGSGVQHLGRQVRRLSLKQEE